MKNKNRGFFDEDIRLEKLSKQGDPLEKLVKMIDWELFRKPLNKTFKANRKVDQENQGGRPAYDYVMMFKILILQRIYNLSDHQMEYQINDRLSFMRFLGLSLGDRVPDEKTIWLFREKLTKNGTIDILYEKFQKQLLEEGIIAQSGSIVDASFIDAPKQRNNRDENDQIKNGEVPPEWEEQPEKKRQKDMDARWATKNKERHYGYKNHVKVDKKSKIVTAYAATDASVHDSQALEKLLDERDAHHELYADSAYSGAPIRDQLKELNIKNKIHEKGYRGSPLTEKQKERNKKKSKVRVRVEHVFGFITNSMNGMFIRCIGLQRAQAQIGLMNLTYNLFRYMQIKRA
jgi:transposase, IS5 family